MILTIWMRNGQRLFPISRLVCGRRTGFVSVRRFSDAPKSIRIELRLSNGRLCLDGLHHVSGDSMRFPAIAHCGIDFRFSVVLHRPNSMVEKIVGISVGSALAELLQICRRKPAIRLPGSYLKLSWNCFLETPRNDRKNHAQSAASSGLRNCGSRH
jgi:hypothetical protein